MATDRQIDWLFERAERRADVVDQLVADYAVSVCGRPALRRDVRCDAAEGVLGKVTWSIDDDVVVEHTAVLRWRH